MLIDKILAQIAPHDCLGCFAEGTLLRRTIADELLPTLKIRFDVVERSQITRVITELKLEQNLQDDFNQQREVGKLAKVRYLVFGSVTRLGGVSVNARLVENPPVTGVETDCDRTAVHERKQ